MGIISIDFHGDRLLGIETEAGALIPLRPLVLGMGLNWSGQLQRVRRDPILSEAVCVTHGPRSRGCVPAPRPRAGLLVQDRRQPGQRGRARQGARLPAHCFAVLAKAFLRPDNLGKSEVSEPTEALPYDLARRLVTEARHTFDRQAGRELWFRLGLPVVPAMTAPPRQGSLFTYEAERR